MKKMNKISKKIMVFGLSAICGILIIGLLIYAQSSRSDDTLQNMGVTPDGTSEAPTDTTVSIITPSQPHITDTETPDIEPPDEIEIPTAEPITEITDDSTETAENEIALTVMPEMPEPPALPETAYPGERTGEATLEDVEAHQALDPALTNPDIKPDIPSPAPVESTTQEKEDDSHLWGQINENGEIYVPGFGWIPNGGPPVMRQSESDGDWDKQIGFMG